jgi:peptide deformylase
VPFTVLANPVVTPSGTTTATFYEGCLSVPGLTGAVGRHADVHVSALDEHGEPCALTYSGWPARIVQHEVDHLNGVLYLDRADTRSLSTLDVYGERWAQQPVTDIAAALGFSADSEPLR